MREVIVIAHNIRSTYNVGAIFRTCEGLGIRQIIISGYTPYPDVSLTRLICAYRTSAKKLQNKFIKQRLAPKQSCRLSTAMHRILASCGQTAIGSQHLSKQKIRSISQTTKHPKNLRYYSVKRSTVYQQNCYAKLTILLKYQCMDKKSRSMCR